jgi:glycosyltransferase involved in cell wall biosynthesis
LYLTRYRQFSGKGQKPVLLVNAGIEPRKGLHILIKAIPFLHKQVEVIVKGGIKNPRYMHELESLVHQLKLESVVTFETSRFYQEEELASLYHRATVFVFPTLEDCLGVAVLEALHSGLPVIATNSSGVTDMIVDRQNGLLVPPGSPRELADAINKLLEDEVLRQNLAGNGLRVLKKHYYENRLTLEQAMKRSIKEANSRRHPLSELLTKQPQCK